MRSIKDLSINLEEDDDSVYSEKKQENVVIDTSRRHPLTGSLVASERMKLMQLLERWEAPEREAAVKVRHDKYKFNNFRSIILIVD
jgi:hypothetical protein